MVFFLLLRSRNRICCGTQRVISQSARPLRLATSCVYIRRHLTHPAAEAAPGANTTSQYSTDIIDRSSAFPQSDHPRLTSNLHRPRYTYPKPPPKTSIPTPHSLFTASPSRLYSAFSPPPPPLVPAHHLREPSQRYRRQLPSRKAPIEAPSRVLPGSKLHRRLEALQDSTVFGARSE